jgi:hypothetical protein
MEVRKNQQREVVMGMLRMLVRYVEVASQGYPPRSRRADSSSLQGRGCNRRRHCPKRSAKSIAAPTVDKFLYEQKDFKINAHFRPGTLNPEFAR